MIQDPFAELDADIVAGKAAADSSSASTLAELDSAIADLKEGGLEPVPSHTPTFGESVSAHFDHAAQAVQGGLIDFATSAATGMEAIGNPIVKAQPMHSSKWGGPEVQVSIADSVARMKAAATEVSQETKESGIQPGFWNTTIPAGFTSMATMLGPGAVVKGLGGAANMARAASLSSGSMLQGQAMFMEARAAGAPEDDQLAAYMMGLGIGTTEMLPVERVLGLASTMGPKGALSGRLLKHFKEGALSEGVQEGLIQTPLEIAVSQHILEYAPKQDAEEILKRVAESFAAGGVVGGATATGVPLAQEGGKVMERWAKAKEEALVNPTLSEDVDGEATLKAPEDAPIGDEEATGTGPAQPEAIVPASSESVTPDAEKEDSVPEQTGTIKPTGAFTEDGLADAATRLERVKNRGLNSDGQDAMAIADRLKDLPDEYSGEQLAEAVWGRADRPVSESEAVEYAAIMESAERVDESEVSPVGTESAVQEVQGDIKETPTPDHIKQASAPGEQAAEPLLAGLPPVKGLEIKLGTLGGAVDKVKAFTRKNLTSSGDLPESTFDAMLKRDSGVNVANQKIKESTQDFKRAAKKTYKGVDKMTPDQVRAVDAAFKNPELVDSLPEEMRAPIRAMREHVDALSRAMIDVGAVEGDLAAHVADNMGFYATRSYRVFDDPKWASKVPEDVRNKAKALFRREYPKATDKQLEGKIDKMLFKGKAAQSPMALITKGKLGSKDLSILVKRKEIAPEIRALFGEHEDALVNYARSVSKMSHLIANHQFLESIEASGLTEGYFTKEPIGENIIEIAADESSVMAPLNGLHTTPEILEAFEEATAPENMPDWLRMYMKANGAVKMSKTVLSIQTNVRNLIGNVGFAVANGHWRAGAFKEGVGGVLTQFGVMRGKEWREYYRDALSHGVIHESARAGELRDIVKDAIDKDPADVLVGQAGKIDFTKPLRLQTEIYQSQDDLWKLYAWENERARYSKAYPDWTEEQVKSKAAEIVRNTYPTYSLVPRLVKKARRFPLVGTFVSFPAEVIRVTGNTIAITKEELSNPETRAIGAQRLAGMMVAATGTSAAAMASRFLMGLTADDDEDMRQFMPPWSENSDIIYLGRSEDGNILWTDAGYTDPYSYLKGPLRALMRGETFGEKVYDAFGEAVDPFLSEEILAKTIREAVSNKRASGGTVYNEADSWSKKSEDVAGHLWKSAFEPGTVSSLRRIKLGMDDYVTTYGKAYDPKIEALATFTGTRVNEMAIEQALMFRARDFNTDTQNAVKILSSTAKRSGDVPDAEIRDAHSSMEASRERVFDELVGAVSAARNLGVSDDVIESRLQGASVTKAMRRAVMAGEYEPYVPTGQFLKFYEKGASEERQAELQARRELVQSIARESQ